MSTRYLSLTVIALLALTIAGIAIVNALPTTVVTVKGLVEVKLSNGKLVPLNEVANPSLFKIVFKNAEGSVVAVATISSNSEYSVQLPAGAKVYPYLESSVGEVKLYRYFFGKYYDYIIVPAVGPVTINLVVFQSDLSKILPTKPVIVLEKVIKAPPSVVYVNQKFTIVVEVKNVGSAAGTANLTLTYDHAVLTSNIVKLGPGEAKNVTLTASIGKAGTYTLSLLLNGKVVKTWTITVKKVTPIVNYTVVKTYIPSTFIVNTPETVYVVIKNTGTVSLKLNVTAIAYAKLPLGQYVKVYCNKTTVSIKPGETKNVTLEIMFPLAKTGAAKEGRVDLLVNGKVVAEKLVKIVRPSAMVRFGERKYVLTIGQEKTITLLLINASQAAGVRVKIRYNPEIINVVSVKAGEFKDEVSGLFKYSVNNVKGLLVIAVAGTQACGVNKTVIAYITIKAVTPGSTMLDIFYATWSTPSGVIYPALTIPSEVVVTKKVAIFKGTITAPPVAYAGVPFNVKVTVKNVGNAPGKATVEIKYDNKICAGPVTTPVLAPGESWTHVFKCTISEVGTYKLSLVANGTVLATTSIVVKKIPPFKVTIKMKPKMYVYWAGYPVTLNVTVIPRVKVSAAINVTVVELTPYGRKVVAQLFEPLVVGKVYTIVKRILLPTYTTTGEMVVYVNGIPVNRTAFKTTGVAVIVKPYTYETISVPLLPLSYVVKNQTIPAPPPGSAPVSLPTLAEVFSLAYDARTGKKIYPWNLLTIYYYDRRASGIPYYVAISPTSTPVRPGMGLVVYSTYPHEIVLIVPVNVSAISTTALRTLLVKTLELAYIPSPFLPGWALVGPIGLVPIKILPTKLLNITLYYTESTNGNTWTTVKKVTAGEYVYPGKGYWIFWNIVTFHAIHYNMMKYIAQYFSPLLK